MKTPSNFPTSPKPRTPLHPSFSPEETQTPQAKISPELFWTFVDIFNNPNLLARIAKRQAGSKNQASAFDRGELVNKPAHNKSKFTGSPAFKELKNLIVVILTSQKGNS